MPTVQTLNRDGLVLKTGAVFRPHDPRSRPYELLTTVPPRAVDLTRPILLVNDNEDWREPISEFGQGGQGACAAFGAESAARHAMRIAYALNGYRMDEVSELHQGKLYHDARLADNLMTVDAPADTGSMAATNLRLLMNGFPLRSTAPYRDDYRWRPGSEFAGARLEDHVLSFRPFYPTDGIEAIGLALQSNMPVTLSMGWRDEFFRPGGEGGCILPADVPRQSVGGHCIKLWGLIPYKNDGLALCTNWWTPAWTPNAAALGYYMRPGDFAVPWSLLRKGGFAWNLEGVSFEPVAPQPPQPPTPPEPEPPAPVDRYEDGHAAGRAERAARDGSVARSLQRGAEEGANASTNDWERVQYEYGAILMDQFAGWVEGEG